MASTAAPEMRAQLVAMAHSWEELAEARKRKLQREGRTEADEATEP